MSTAEGLSRPSERAPQTAPVRTLLTRLSLDAPMVMLARPYEGKRASAWAIAGALWRLGRYRSLAGGFVLYGLGAALARTGGGIDLGAYMLGQGVITCTQLMTHYGNDYFDRGSDGANLTRTNWSGGSGVLQQGLVRPRLARNIAIGFGVAAVALVAVIEGTRHVDNGNDSPVRRRPPLVVGVQRAAAPPAFTRSRSADGGDRRRGPDSAGRLRHARRSVVESPVSLGRTGCLGAVCPDPRA